MATIRRLPPHLLVLLALAVGVALAHASARRAVVSKVPPIYPELAHRMHIYGIVIVRVTVAPDGTVSNAKAESGHPLLSPAATDAVRRWRFEPSSETSDLTVDVHFSDN